MVLQRGVPVRIWGWADPDEAVRVEFQGQTVSSKAGQDGKWVVWLKPLAAAGPLAMTVAGSNSIVINDVLVGEVWIGSGQSNMEFPLSRANNHDQEIAAADYPLIHIFMVKRKVAEQPMDDIEGTWAAVTPQSIPTFSAVEYFFGRDLYGKLHVPMGLIESNWGGTPAEAWTSPEALAADPLLKYAGEEWSATLARYPAAQKAYERRLSEWQTAAKAAKAGGNTPAARPRPPQGPGSSHAPSVLYNAMIAPLTPFAIRGVIWYQGENNANEGHAYRYRTVFRDMIEDWRNRWGEGDFPFLFVQLANFKSNPFWPVLRESQTETLRLRNTGMAVIIDIGNPDNIHPTDKQDVGYRLSLAARHIAYGEAVEDSGPLFRQATVEGGAMRVWFTHAAGMQARGGGALTGFTIAGADGQFVPAEARVEGTTVVVSSAQVAAPTAVRYAWADNPECNLVNQEGLPASPFRSGEPHYQ